MIRGLRFKGTTSVHLVFGQHYHAGLELYDRLAAEDVAHEVALHEVVLDLLRRTWEPDEWETGDGINCTFSTIKKKGGPWQSDHPVKTRETLIRSVVWYLEEFGAADPAKTLILANGKPAVELTFKFDSGIEICSYMWEDAAAAAQTKATDSDEEYVEPSRTYVLSGHLDRVATFAGDNYVFDHKTSSTTLSPSFFSQFNPHTQMSLYTIAGEAVFGIPLRGVMISGVQVAVGFTRFARAPTFRSPGQLEEYLAELPHWFRQAEAFASADYWPKNEESCHHYGGCPFRRICSLDPGVRERFIEMEYEVRRWNPLETRDK